MWGGLGLPVKKLLKKLSRTCRTKKKGGYWAANHGGASKRKIEGGPVKKQGVTGETAR